MAAASAVSYHWVTRSPCVSLNKEFKIRGRVITRSAFGEADPTVSNLDQASVSVTVNELPAPLPIEKEKTGSLVGENGYAATSLFEVEEKTKTVKKRKQEGSEKLEVLWEDGFGTRSVKEYLDDSKVIIRSDGGSPRWFCPIECGQPLKGSPVLLFLPGLDGTGLGLLLHHQSLGRVFEVRCLHIPVYDQTPFEELVKQVEETVRSEHASSPKTPIYLIGESFGGCLALAVAARNPSIDLVVIVANPATSFGRSQLQPLLPALEALPDELHFMLPYLLSFIMGEPTKMAIANIDKGLPPGVQLQQLSDNLTSLLPRLSILSEIVPKEALLWKLKLLRAASSYANSRLHAIRAEVMVLASGKDNMLPSVDEAKRIMNLLKNCKVRIFKDNGHTLFIEDGINLLSVIKGTSMYRRSSRHDFVADFQPPSMWEYRTGFEQVVWILRHFSNSLMLSTLEDGTIVKGLLGVPAEGPVLLVGNHMLMGLELYSLVEEFLREKKIMVRGLAHPELFAPKSETPTMEFGLVDWLKVFGATPVTASNLFKLLSTKSHVLLYPGGAREALHYKGEEYKLFWPKQPEFVRMAARFGATIVPFGAVGEDDLAELVLDYNDLMKIPVVNDFIRVQTRDLIRVRQGTAEEFMEEQLFIPGMLPKIPGRLYYLFGKPIVTRGKEALLMDKGNANEVYLQIKSEVERSLAYLLKKREKDPYRNIFNRAAYKVLRSPLHEVPAFEP